MIMLMPSPNFSFTKLPILTIPGFLLLIKMENGGKFGTININLKMVLKKSETFNKFKGKNIRDKFEMHPPPRKPK
jgi:hypothetical protein